MQLCAADHDMCTHHRVIFHYSLFISLGHTRVKEDTRGMHPGSLPAHIQSCSPLASSLKVHPLAEHSTHMHFVQEDLRVEGLLLRDSHHSQRYHRGGRSCTRCTASDRSSPPVTDWPRTACTTGGLHGDTNVHFNTQVHRYCVLHFIHTQS